MLCDRNQLYINFSASLGSSEWNIILVWTTVYTNPVHFKINKFEIPLKK